MARAAYITRKDGRYWFQKRFAGPDVRPSHLRVSLRTADYRTAVGRMLRTMWTVEQYEVCADLAQRGRFLLGKLEACNAAGVPATVDAAIERRTLEVLVNRFPTEAQARNHPVVQDQPDFWPAWMRFCDDCAEGETLARRAERRAYELGRAHADEAAAAGWSQRAAPIEASERRVRGEAVANPDIQSIVSAAAVALPRAPRLAAAPPAEPALRASAPEVPESDAADDLSPQSKLSRVVAEYLDIRRIADGDGRAAEDVGIVLAFAIALLGDRAISSYAAADFLKLEKALPSIPDRRNIPREHAGSLHARYLYAQTHGWDGLKPISRKRLKNGWYRCLHLFFDWVRDKNLSSAPRYTFKLVADRNLDEQERDAWRDDEILRLFSLPLFTGCASRERFWTKGRYLVQNDTYWAYILIFFTGMRPSEIGKVRVADIVEISGIWHIDLRRDKTKPVAEADARRLKTKSAYRLVPLPQLLIDLGLLDRKADLEAAGEERLFPEWIIYRHPTSGRVLSGHHFSKSWQYIKSKFAFARPALTLYGGRHTRAGWYDAAGIPQRVRNRLLGHAPTTVADTYGPVELTPEEARLVFSRSNAVEEAVAELLVTTKHRADYGELAVLKTWTALDRGDPVSSDERSGAKSARLHAPACAAQS